MNPPEAQSHTGWRGWKLPLAFSEEGRIADGSRTLEESLRLLLETVPGERPLLPAFGCAVHRLARIETAEERALAEALIEESIERWFPDVPLERVRLERVSPGMLELRVDAAGRRRFLRLRRKLLRREDTGEFPEEAEV